MWTLSGTKGAMAEITMLDRTSTNKVARPMLSPLMADVVVASVGHIPRRRTNVGFSLKKPLVKMSSFLLLMVYSPFIVLKASTAFFTARV